MDNGVKASASLAEPVVEERRKHGMTWSGLYNSNAKVNNTNRDFALASGSFATDKYVTLIVVRSDTDTGNINLYVRGADSGYFDGTATGTVVGSEIADPTEITISDIGSADNDTQNFSGFISDVMIWDGTAASSADREEIFDYIEAQ